MLSNAFANSWPGEYDFCPRCGSTMATETRGGRPRRVCQACRWVHFRNPGVGVAVLLRDESGRVLLVRRAPGSTREGAWCIPCGYLDYGEEVRAGAAREVREETGLIVDVGEPVFVRSNFHDPAKLTVGIWFLGVITGGRLTAGDDADDVAWFDTHDLPDLAFPTDEELLGSLRG